MIKNFFSIAWMLIIRWLQIIWFLTIGLTAFLLAMIAIECAFTGKDFFKLFR